MYDMRITKEQDLASLKRSVKKAHEERGFEFSKGEWGAIKKAGFSKFDIAKLCCEKAVLAEVECYDRQLIVAWNLGPSEDSVLNILEKRYYEWVHLDDCPEAENYCCEEWMLDGLSELGSFRFFVLYDRGLSND